MSKLGSVWMVMCVGAALQGCAYEEEEYDERLYGTSGSGSGTGGSDGTSSSTGTGTGGGTTSGSSGGNTTSGLTCQIHGKKGPVVTEPPVKTDTGLWDQGGWGACGYIALINANLLSGADDTDGNFEQRVRDCLEARGIQGPNIADGLTDAEMQDIAECKEEEMDADGNAVSIDNYEMSLFRLKDLCGELDDALDNGGSASASFQKPGSGHALTVTGVQCDESSDEITLELMDPNFPNGDTYEVTVDCEDEVTDVRPPHFWLDNTTRVHEVFIETPTN